MAGPKILERSVAEGIAPVLKTARETIVSSNITIRQNRQPPASFLLSVAFFARSKPPGRNLDLLRHWTPFRMRALPNCSLLQKGVSPASLHTNLVAIGAAAPQLCAGDVNGGAFGRAGARREAAIAKERRLRAGGFQKALQLAQNARLSHLYEFDPQGREPDMAWCSSIWRALRITPNTVARTSMWARPTEGKEAKANRTWPRSKSLFSAMRRTRELKKALRPTRANRKP